VGAAGGALTSGLNASAQRNFAAAEALPCRGAERGASEVDGAHLSIGHLSIGVIRTASSAVRLRTAPQSAPPRPCPAAASQQGD
jgi:hypothetical protein